MVCEGKCPVCGRPMDCDEKMCAVCEAHQDTKPGDNDGKAIPD